MIERLTHTHTHTHTHTVDISLGRATLQIFFFFNFILQIPWVSLSDLFQRGPLGELIVRGKLEVWKMEWKYYGKGGWGGVQNLGICLMQQWNFNVLTQKIFVFHSYHNPVGSLEALLQEVTQPSKAISIYCSSILHWLSLVAGGGGREMRLTHRDFITRFYNFIILEMPTCYWPEQVKHSHLTARETGKHNPTTSLWRREKWTQVARATSVLWFNPDFSSLLRPNIQDPDLVQVLWYNPKRIHRQRNRHCLGSLADHQEEDGRQHRTLIHYLCLYSQLHRGPHYSLVQENLWRPNPPTTDPN